MHYILNNTVNNADYLPGGDRRDAEVQAQVWRWKVFCFVLKSLFFWVTQNMTNTVGGHSCVTEVNKQQHNRKMYHFFEIKL